MSALQHAPSYVRAWIHSVPATSGQLLSQERVFAFSHCREDHFVWISVPCTSLGLLGKDVLDALVQFMIS